MLDRFLKSKESEKESNGESLERTQVQLDEGTLIQLKRLRDTLEKKTNCT